MYSMQILVHHDFEPLQLYVVLLCSSRKAVLLAYHDLKVLQQWDGVKDIASADRLATGTPQLILTELDDRAVVVPNAKLMSFPGGSKKESKEERMGEEEEDGAGKKEAVLALTHMLQGGIKLADQLRTERKMKENFIREELAVLQSRLEGHLDEKEESLVPALTVQNRKDDPESVPSLSPNPLKVLRVYHKLVHDKWVVGINVINDGDQVLVSHLELILCCGEVPLYHSSHVLKTVRHSRQQGEDVRVTIDHLDPPILKPKKRATVVGVCEMPSFETGPSVSCSGLLSYTCKPLRIVSSQSLESDSECQIQEYQVSVPLVELKASELHCHLASLDLSNSIKTASVSFSTVALVAASRCSKVSLTSLVSPLNTFITRISHHLKLVKMAGVSDFYVLYPGNSHPLQHTGFTLHPVDSHNLNLTLYSKDEKQALVLAHTLLAALPEDTNMQFFHGPKDASSSILKPLNLHHVLLARMREAATLVMDGLEGQLSSNKTPRIEREEGSREQEDGFAKYRKEREELLTRKGDITFKGNYFSEWRKKLQNVQTEVDNLYLQFLKLNCASD